MESKTITIDATACNDTPNDTNKSLGGGGWNWPMQEPHLSQCYGKTPWAWMYSSGFHNGIDMYNNNSILIKASEEGDAFYYRGGQEKGNGVFIYHKDGKMTMYWHLQ